MSVELLSCPFCQGEGRLRQSRVAANLYRVECINCDAGPGSVLGEDRAIAAWNTRPSPPSLQSVMGEDKLGERICHKEQLGIWANEIATAIALGGFLKEDWTFDDSVDLDREIEAQLLDIIKSAFTHPEFNVTEALQSLKAQTQALREALEKMLRRFELYAGENDIHAGHHDRALLELARAALSSQKGEGV